MTLEELQQDDWYKERPECVQRVVDIIPPIRLYKFKNSGKQCYIVSYEESHSGKMEDVTFTVQKTGIGGAMAEMGMGHLDTNAVFGLKPDDLEPFNP